VRAASKPDGGVLHAGLIEIGPKDGLKAIALKGGGNVFCIMRRVGQMRRMDIGAVTDHQRNAIISERRDSGTAKKHSREDHKRCAAAHNPSCQGGDQVLILQFFCRLGMRERSHMGLLAFRRGHRLKLGGWHKTDEPGRSRDVR
jgi:hypothetical protein